MKFKGLLCFLIFLKLGMTPFLALAQQNTERAGSSFEFLRDQAVFSDKDPNGDLKPLPEAKPLLQQIYNYLTSEQIETLTRESKALSMLRSGLFTSLFHLNLEPEVNNKDRPKYTFLDSSYPYEPVYEKPFPKRPTLEFFDQALAFIEAVKSLSHNHIDSDKLTGEINNFSQRKSFQDELNQRLRHIYNMGPQNPNLVREEVVASRPVDSYIVFRARLQRFGEVASFPEFEATVRQTLNTLSNDSEIKNLSAKDAAFAAELEATIKELNIVLSESGEAKGSSASFQDKLPYRRTILALERAVFIFDINERSKYGVSENWYEVENSWYPKKTDYKGNPLVMELYHYNRYKYQQFGLLSNPDVIFMPWHQPLSEVDLIKMRAVPIGLVGVNFKTQRADRHHNTPIDFWYHDVNHIRRMWGYDKKSVQGKSIHSWTQLVTEFRSRELFVSRLLKQTDPNQVQGNSIEANDEKHLREMERQVLFETLHETALPATREAVLNDIFRHQAVRQPFERMMQNETQIELQRTFDGNVFSGANKFMNGFSVDRPTKVLYYWDRAPNFLANIDNKGRWGFHGSVYEQRKDSFYSEFYSPANVARAADRILDRVDFRNGERGLEKPSIESLTASANARDGQRELWNYWALNPREDISHEGREIMNRSNVIDFRSPEQQAAQELLRGNPNLKPEELANRIVIGQELTNLLKWMLSDLENYLKNFDLLFDKKLQRIIEHHRQRYTDLNQRLMPLKARLASEPNNSSLKTEITRIEREHKVHAFVQQYESADEFLDKFVGTQGKLLTSKPTDRDLQLMNKPGQKQLYVDTWSVPFFNTGTQTKQGARNGVIQAISEFRSALVSGDITYLKFTNLVALFARPEFDDIRRHKLKLFPNRTDNLRYGSERNDAKFAANHFPNQGFLFTNRQIDLDPLSYTFGQRINVIGLISHSANKVNADGRIFTGPADFFEHDIAHAYFSLSKPFPGTPAQWREIHDRFFFKLNAEPDAGKRKMMSLVYFHLTHESGYTALLPNAEGILMSQNAYSNLKRDIIEKIQTRYYYDWVLNLSEVKGNYSTYLDSAFAEVFDFFRREFNEIMKQSPVRKATSSKMNLKNRSLEELSMSLPLGPRSSSKFRCSEIFK